MTLPNLTFPRFELTERLRRRAVRIILAGLLQSPVVQAQSVDYTDIWYDPQATGPGWGINLVQSPGFIFATFFVYDSNGAPGWYTGELVRQADGSYTGPLNRTKSTAAPTPFSPQSGTNNVVGNAHFTPASSTRGKLNYTLNNMSGELTIERLTLKGFDLNPAPFATQLLNHTASDCDTAANNTAPSTNLYALGGVGIKQKDNTVTVTYSTSSTTIQSGRLVIVQETCTITGELVQTGRLAHLDHASYTCKDDKGAPTLSTTADVYDISARDNVIELYWTAKVKDNCTERAHFMSAPRP